MNQIEKQPYEQFPIYVNFYNNLDENESLSSYAITCVDMDNGSNSLSGIVLSNAIEDAKVKVVLKSGSAPGRHKLTVRAGTNSDNTFETDIIIILKNADTESFTKQPNEEFIVENDFSGDLVSGETISSKTITATRISDGSDVTSGVIEFSAISDKKILVGVMRGDNGESYRIAIKIDTSGGNKYQKNAIMRVREQ